MRQSIRERGILQPLLVRPAPAVPRVTRSSPASGAGARPSVAGLHEVPTIVRELSDQETLELALIENLQRTDLSPLDEAQAFRRLIDDFGHTQDELAQRDRQEPQPRRQHAPVADAAGGGPGVGRGRQPVGWPRPRPDRVRARGASGPRDHRGRLNVRDTEALVRRDTMGQRPDRGAGAIADPHVKELEERLTSHLGLEVGIRAKRSGGVLTIRYRDLGQLDGLIRRLQ